MRPTSTREGVIPESKYEVTLTEKVTIFSGRGLEEELSKVHSTLSTTGGSGDWKQRIEALQMVRSLLIAGAGQFEELTSQVGTHLTQTPSYSSPFLPQLKALEYPFESCVKDLRSQVSTEHILFCLLDGDICHLVFSTWQMFRL